MTQQRRDQRQYDLVQQYLPGLILNTVLRIVQDLDDPYRVRPSLGGMRAYPPKAMATVCIIMEAERKTRRGMVGYLANHRNIVLKLGLPKIPSKSTISRAYGLIPEPYLMEVHRRIMREITAESVAGDSTAYSESRFARWYDHRAGRLSSRKEWAKLHAIIDIPTRVVLDYLVTDGRAADIAALYVMLERFRGGSGLFCLDSAYLARRMCDAIDGLGMVPRIRPKTSTVCKTGGSQAWGDMIRLHRDDPDGFMSEYHQRSIIEAVFGAIKKVYGNEIKCRRPDNQNREIATRVICYNVDLVARSQVKEGRLTHESIAALAA